MKILLPTSKRAINSVPPALQRILTLLLLFTTPVFLQAGELRLSVAASMTDTVRELTVVFATEHPDIRILPNFASSGALAKQIVRGAPADLYISANKKWVAYLIKEKQLVPETEYVLAYNSLVFVGREGKEIHRLRDLIRLERIAIGSPRSVPAGQYAAQAMKAARIYETLTQKHALVMAKDVRQALLYADRGEVDGAFIYGTDALLARNSMILFTVAADMHTPITYSMALTAAGSKNRDARIFYNFLKTAPAAKILSKYGFTDIGVQL